MESSLSPFYHSPIGIYGCLKGQQGEVRFDICREQGHSGKPRGLPWHLQTSEGNLGVGEGSHLPGLPWPIARGGEQRGSFHCGCCCCFLGNAQNVWAGKSSRNELSGAYSFCKLLPSGWQTEVSFATAQDGVNSRCVSTKAQGLVSENSSWDELIVVIVNTYCGLIKKADPRVLCSHHLLSPHNKPSRWDLIYLVFQKNRNPGPTPTDLLALISASPRPSTMFTHVLRGYVAARNSPNPPTGLIWEKKLAYLPL